MFSWKRPDNLGVRDGRLAPCKRSPNCVSSQAERLGLVSLACEEPELQAKALELARELAAGAQTALRWTKYSLNNWLRMAGPAFDASLALEVLGFTGPEAKEGIAALREKRPPSFPAEPKDF